MDTQIILVYCLCDELLQAMNHQQHPQCQLSDAEVMTTAIVAMPNISRNEITADPIATHSCELLKPSWSVLPASEKLQFPYHAQSPLAAHRD